MVYVPPKYPSAIPTVEDLPDREDDVSWIYAARYNELKKELRAALIELGTLPKGEYADVKARLDAAAVGDKILEGDSSVEVIDTNGDGHVDIKTENVLCGKFNSDGIHDLAKQSRARAVLSSNQLDIEHMTITKILLDAETYDNQNEFASYKFTAKKSGYYQVNAGIVWLGPSVIPDVQYNLYITRNGAYISLGRFVPSAADYFSQIYSDVVSLAANDYLELFCRHYGGVDTVDVYGNSRDTFMSVHKLS